MDPKFRHNLQDLHALAVANNSGTQEQVKERADFLAKERTFEIGDLVCLHLI